MQVYDFQCNVCGAPVHGIPFAGMGREGASCFTCGSSVRMRGIVHNLSVGLFGTSISAPDFPIRPDLVGIGLSDWPGYAGQLARKFTYTNTFYHQEPFLDIVAPPPERLGTCDFLISTDVFEHVPPPVSRAFDGALALLKPGGLLVLTVPFADGTETVEHFPELETFKIVEIGGEHVLVNRASDGRYALYSDLVFHGGPGDTLEMRVFSRTDTDRLLRQAGFWDIQFHDEEVPQWGIVLQHQFGVTITARRPRP